ncbi:hypothetical protein TrST_g10657 [Triparma strigata]|uniref:JmjC domain-containing protein n=1 Tax=Triparma strigata TaxID=1606541 RepID=A0A9W7ASM0_9STRA|nr:hypothetical protein TrST_g10657 [Triparma strigata]
MELPFKVRNVKEIDEAVLKWSDPNYLLGKLERNKNLRGKEESSVSYSVDAASTSFFTWYDHRRVKPYINSGLPNASTYKEPHKPSSMSATEYFKHAIIKGDWENKITPDSPSYYLQLGVNGINQKKTKSHSNTFIHTDLPSFITPPSNFFVFDFTLNKGVQCRLGTKHTTAAAHYDNGRNMIALISGSKRYVLLPPKECKNLSVVKIKEHPSRRHVLLDFKDILEDIDGMEEARESFGVDTIVKAGEVLYVPSRWFHYITSLQFSVQCNSRSGANLAEEEEGWDNEEFRMKGGGGDFGRASTKLYGGAKVINQCVDW